jgi:hypothetical protein
MANWKQQNETIKASIADCLAALAGKGGIWITCDSDDHTAKCLDGMAKVLRVQDVAYYVFDPEASMLDDLRTTWERITDGSPVPNPVLHWKGLGFYTEEVFEHVIPGFYEALSAASDLSELTFTTVIWTTSKSRELIVKGAPAFAKGIPHHFHLESPPIVIEHEIEAMELELADIPDEALEELVGYQVARMYDLMEQTRDPKDARLLLDRAGMITMEIERFEDAVTAFEESIRLPIPLVPVKKAAYQTRIGECLFELGELTKAAARFQDALRTYKTTRDEEGQATCLHFLGKIADEEGDFGKAIDYLQAALEAALGVEAYEATTREIVVLLGGIYAGQDRLDEALAVYDRYFEEELHTESLTGEIELSITKADLLSMMDQVGAATALLQDLSARVGSLPATPESALLHLNCGLLQFKRGGELASLSSFAKAAADATEVDDLDTLYMTHVYEGRVRLLLKENMAAVQAYYKAAALAEEADELNVGMHTVLLNELEEELGQEGLQKLMDAG